MPSTPVGRFTWYELLTTDREAAPRFYAAVAGWGTVPWDGGPEPYTMWTNGESPIGGVMQLPPEAVEQGAGAHWLAHISTPDVVATVAAAQEMGATVMHREAVPTVGSFAIMKDPHGALFSAYQPEGDTPGHDGEPALGEISWHELMAGDLDEAWNFYSRLFAWSEVDRMDLGPQNGTYLMFQGQGRMLGGMMAKPPGSQAAWLLYIHVDGVESALVRVRDAGGTVLSGPMEVPGGDWVAQCLDAQGAPFALHARG
jgi:hypothetical protein